MKMKQKTTELMEKMCDAIGILEDKIKVLEIEFVKLKKENGKGQEAKLEKGSKGRGI